MRRCGNSPAFHHRCPEEEGAEQNAGVPGPGQRGPHADRGPGAASTPPTRWSPRSPHRRRALHPGRPAPLPGRWQRRPAPSGACQGPARLAVGLSHFHTLWPHWVEVHPPELSPLPRSRRGPGPRGGSLHPRMSGSARLGRPCRSPSLCGDHRPVAPPCPGPGSRAGGAPGAAGRWVVQTWDSLLTWLSRGFWGAHVLRPAALALVWFCLPRSFCHKGRGLTRCACREHLLPESSEKTVKETESGQRRAPDPPFGSWGPRAAIRCLFPKPSGSLAPRRGPRPRLCRDVPSLRTGRPGSGRAVRHAGKDDGAGCVTARARTVARVCFLSCGEVSVAHGVCGVQMTGTDPAFETPTRASPWLHEAPGAAEGRGSWVPLPERNRASSGRRS